MDYVRVYEEDLGKRQKPKVTLSMRTLATVVPPGKDITLDVAAEKTGSAVKDVLLFDNGRIRAERAAASARFTVPASQLYSGENVLIAMARDSGDLVGMSEPLTLLVTSASQRPGKPYQGRPQVVPGRIVAGYYDEGGQGRPMEAICGTIFSAGRRGN